ncbi:ABC transporter permease [Marisediminicola antarctica]|uniref:ABC transporter permease n=1 Tax=Marisediminicola antarctica TaxID=674079 RepID=A0A7L5AK76_9MICO|nr:ABC transporter permease [Marisediminicola antarctica]QHO68709.1 hypothetical protein BHD05_02695 [Marisediminicola antarctica]
MTRSRLIGAALEAEWLKFRSALVPRVATAALVLGIAALSSSFALVAGQPESLMAAKLNALVVGTGWTALVSLASQITAVGGLLGFGVVLAWLFGREFADGVIAGLFALPVRRGTTAAAKLLVYAGWALALSAALVGVILGIGLALGFGAPTSADAGSMARLFVIALLTAGLALPAALVATIARGYLAPIGSVIALVAIAQIAVVLGAGGWFPWAAPGLWAGLSGVDATSRVTLLQLLLVVPVAAASVALTTRAWARLQL